MKSRKNSKEQQLVAKDHQIVEKQKEFDQLLTQVNKEFVESKNEPIQTLIMKDQLLTEKEQSQLTEQNTEYEAKLQPFCPQKSLWLLPKTASLGTTGEVSHCTGESQS